MASGTEAPYPARKNTGRMPPLPDEMPGSPIYKVLPNGERIKVGNTILRPNDPAPPHEPTPDRRPQVLYTDKEFTEEYWNERLAKRNGRATP